MFPRAPPFLRAPLRLVRGPVVAVIVLLVVVIAYYNRSLIATDDDITVIKLDPERHRELAEQFLKDSKSEKPPKLLINPADKDTIQPPVFEFGVPKPNGQNYSKTVVIARTKKEDVSWVSEKFGAEGLDGPGVHEGNGLKETPGGVWAVMDDWDVLLYTTDDTTEQYHTPLNKGRETMAYLTYIVDNYDTLPDISVFLHAHRSSWHDNLFALDTPSMLHHLNLDRVARLGYMNMRCSWEPGCPDHIHPDDTHYDSTKPEQAIIAAAWHELFPLVPEVPHTLSQPCCAQFALTRERIRALPLAQYVVLRDWVLNTDLEDSLSGRVFEYVYQYLWTGEPVVCPEEDVCYCEAFGFCFEGGRAAFDEYVRLEMRKRRPWIVKMGSWLVERVEKGLFGVVPPEEVAIEQPVAVDWPRARSEGWLKADTHYGVVWRGIAAALGIHGRTT